VVDWVTTPLHHYTTTPLRRTSLHQLVRGMRVGLRSLEYCKSGITPSFHRTPRRGGGGGGGAVSNYLCTVLYTWLIIAAGEGGAKRSGLV
jgi:hypothetical protein